MSAREYLALFLRPDRAVEQLPPRDRKVAAILMWFGAAIVSLGMTVWGWPQRLWLLVAFWIVAASWLGRR